MPKIFFSNSNTGSAENEDFFYILAFKSNMAETIGLDENAVSGSTDYTQFTSSDDQYSNIATVSNLATYDATTIINRTFKSGIGKGDDGNYEIASTYSDKQNLQILIRGNNVELTHVKGSCIIESIEFKGSHYSYTIKLPSGKIIEYISQDNNLKVSDNVTLSIKKGITIHIYQDEKYMMSTKIKHE